MALAATALALAGASTAAAGNAPELLLPDLDQRAPTGLVVTAVGQEGQRRYRLGFASAVDNVGRGSLIVHGHRSSLDEPAMTADQEVLSSDGSSSVYRGAAELRYVRSEDHQHWHLLPFETYELRRGFDFALLGRDRKTGFCLGDRYRAAGQRLPGTPEGGVYTRRCGLRAPLLLRLKQGISVGYGDNYLANLEGQFLEVTGLPAGKYYLVHRVNAERRLLESNYDNNAAAVLISLSWPRRGAEPDVVVLSLCERSERC